MGLLVYSLVAMIVAILGKDASSRATCLDTRLFTVETTTLHNLNRNGVVSGIRVVPTDRPGRLELVTLFDDGFYHLAGDYCCSSHATMPAVGDRVSAWER